MAKDRLFGIEAMLLASAHVLLGLKPVTEIQDGGTEPPRQPSGNNFFDVKSDDVPVGFTIDDGPQDPEPDPDDEHSCDEGHDDQQSRGFTTYELKASQSSQSSNHNTVAASGFNFADDMPPITNSIAPTLPSVAQHIAAPVSAPVSASLYDDVATPDVAASESPSENGTLSTTVAVGSSGSSFIDGVLVGTRWNGAISYSDPDAASDYQAGYSTDQNGNTINALNEAFSQFNAQQLLALHAALNNDTFTQLAAAGGFAVEGFTNLDVSYAGTGTGSGTIRAANSGDAATAFAFYPSSSIYGGDTFFGNFYDATSNSLKTPTAGNYAWHTMIHELGHSLGLKHGHEGGGPGGTALPSGNDSLEYSVMTYRTFIGDDLNGYNYEQWGAPQTYMMADIAALQFMYGADFGTQSGNTTYSWDPTTGQTFIDGALAISPGGNRIFATIWDGNGIDTYNLSNYTTNLTIDLAPGAFSVFSTAQLAYLGGGPNGGYARGNVFNALQYNGDARSLIEKAIGGSGADTIYGNTADNTLVGGGGLDVMYGLEGNDSYYVDVLGDQAYDSVGVDTLYAGAISLNLGAATYSGIENATLTGSGNFSLTGNGGANTLIGNTGNNVIVGGAGVDTMYGGAGNDSFYVDVLGDKAYDGAGTDTLYSAAIAIDLQSANYLNLENAQLLGSAILNVLGTSGVNRLIGNTNENFIEGRGGADVLSGGGGVDRFIFRESLGAASGNDRITDFTIDDFIRIDSLAVVSVTPLSANQFRLGTTALDADDRVMYDQSTGIVRFDADGNGAGAALAIFTLDTKPVISHTEFVLI